MSPDRFVQRLVALGRPVVDGSLADYNSFLQRSFPTWVAIRPRGAAVGADAIVALYEAYDVAGVIIGNYNLQPLSLQNDGLVHFATEGATDYWVREGEVHAMYYKEWCPEATGQSSASFLECLLVEAEFIARCTLRVAASPNTLAPLLHEGLAAMRKHTSLPRWTESYERSLAELQVNRLDR